MQKTGIFKNAECARQTVPGYDAIPKSVFALMAWYLADAASDEGVGNNGEVRRLREEIEALEHNGILNKGLAKRALSALSAKFGNRD